MSRMTEGENADDRYIREGKGKGKAGTLIEYILDGVDDFVVYGYLVVEVRAG